MGDKPSHGQQGSDTNPAPATGDLAEIKALLGGLSSELAALKASVPVTVNAALTARLKREGPKDGEDGAGGDPPEPTPGKKPAAANPELVAMQRQLAALQADLATKEAEAQAAHRERALRAAIASSGVAVVDPEAAYRVLVADFEPDENGALRPRDPAQTGKPLDQVVKTRIGAMPFLHAPTGRASGGGTGTAKPTGSGFQSDPDASDEENVRRWRAHNAAVGA